MSDTSSHEASDQKFDRLTFRYFRGTWTTWEALFQQAAEFANEIGRERVVSISHSADQSIGVVTVWYWTNSTSHHCH